MRTYQSLTLNRFSIQILLLLNERLSNYPLLTHLRNLGAESFCDHLLMEAEDIRDEETREEVESMCSELAHLLYILKD